MPREKIVVDLDHLTNWQIKLVTNAIFLSFTRAQLRAMLGVWLNMDIDDLAPPGKLEERVRAVVVESQKRGFTKELIEVIEAERPNSERIQTLRAELARPEPDPTARNEVRRPGAHGRDLSPLGGPRSVPVPELAEPPPDYDVGRYDGDSTSQRDFKSGHYLVWYGTNRLPRDPNNPKQGYSADRDQTVHFGKCLVYVPKSHKIGSLGSALWRRLLTFSDDRLRLQETTELPADIFWRQVHSHLSHVPVADRQAVVFVHGYNVSFADAALRAAQIGFDLSINGSMAFFSWPSQGTVGGYPDDEATIEASEGAITDFMVDFARKSGADTVHIIAHSMGNRGVLRAVSRIAQSAQLRSQVMFGQVILAAADVDADSFRQLSTAYARVAARTTMYVSASDKALAGSRWLHGYPRAGISPPVCIVPGIDTINVTNVDMSLLGHGYVGEVREVLQDIHRLINSTDPPDRRFGLRYRRTERGERYWEIGR